MSIFVLMSGFEAYLLLILISVCHFMCLLTQLVADVLVYFNVSPLNDLVIMPSITLTPLCYTNICQWISNLSGEINWDFFIFSFQVGAGALAPAPADQPAGARAPAGLEEIPWDGVFYIGVTLVPILLSLFNKVIDFLTNPSLTNYLSRLYDDVCHFVAYDLTSYLFYLDLTCKIATGLYCICDSVAMLSQGVLAYLFYGGEFYGLPVQDIVNSYFQNFNQHLLDLYVDYPNQYWFTHPYDNKSDQHLYVHYANCQLLCQAFDFHLKEAQKALHVLEVDAFSRHIADLCLINVKFSYYQEYMPTLCSKLAGSVISPSDITVFNVNSAQPQIVFPLTREKNQQLAHLIVDQLYRNLKRYCKHKYLAENATAVQAAQSAGIDVDSFFEQQMQTDTAFTAEMDLFFNQRVYVNTSGLAEICF